MKVGVLALQGAVSEHLEVVESLGATGRAVRFTEDLDDLHGLIIPGGESTTLEKLVRRFDLDTKLQERIDAGMAVWGTCAGMILISQEVVNGIPGQTGLGHVPMAVKRNAFGRQVDSCEVDVDIPAIGAEPFPAVFIRAPIVERFLSPDVEELARHQDTLVAVRYGPFLATSFHPELTGDRRLHSYFLDMSR